jgi:hypothetical protein
MIDVCDALRKLIPIVTGERSALDVRVTLTLSASGGSVAAIRARAPSAASPNRSLPTAAS